MKIGGALIEYAKGVAAIRWPKFSDSSRVTFARVKSELEKVLEDEAIKRETGLSREEYNAKLDSMPNMESRTVDLDQFVTPGGVCFGMQYVEDFDELIISA